MSAQAPRPLSSLGETQPRRGARLLLPLERLIGAVIGSAGRLLSPADNPLARLGALANLALIVATATGVLLLFWYVPSHESAYASVEAMAESPWLAGLLRSLHRYSSDAAMLLVALHAVHIFAQRKATGPRWLPWVTGVVSVGLIWLVGWLGYWLVWDERAQLVAQGTARGLDVLPIFVDPLSSSFLTDASVPSLLFFVVFFLHILLPLMLVIGLWLHISRLSRAAWLPGRALCAWSGAALLALSLLAPAGSAGPAQMTQIPIELTGDWWYLWPLMLTERMSGGALWALTLGGMLAIGAVPLWLRRRAPRSAPPFAGAAPAEVGEVAVVDPSKCNACQSCFHDCPFDAISMVPRQDARAFPSVALVDPDRCMRCGVCSGSCDSSAVSVPWLTQPQVRARVDGWLRERATDGGGEAILFACARAAGHSLEADPASGLSSTLPGYRIVALPCAGWLHPITVERALRRGAAGVLIATCTEANCATREGATWLGARLDGTRAPALRQERIDLDRIHRVALDAHETRALVDEAKRFRARLDSPGRSNTMPRPPHGRRAVWLAGAALAGSLTLLTWTLSDAPLPLPAPTSPELVITFKAAGEVREACTELSEAELARMPAHKRIPQVCERTRAPVELNVRIDDGPLQTHVFRPGGAFEDGASRGELRLRPGPGARRVEVALSSSGVRLGAEMATRHFEVGSRQVLRFDRAAGFEWHGGVASK